MDDRLEQIGLAGRAAARRIRPSVPRPAPRWAGLAAGVLSLALAHGLAATSTPHLGVFALCLLAVAAIAAATTSLFVWADADTTRVFRSRSLAMVTAAMALVASCATTRLALSSPFTQLLATGQFGRSDIADLGCVLAATITLFGLVVGVTESWTTYRQERRWPEELRDVR